jgi:hypothetical protein
MAMVSIAATAAGYDNVLDAAARALGRKGHDVSVAPLDSDARLAKAQFVVRFQSDEDGAGLARTAKHVLLALRDVTGEFPERMAFYDHTGTPLIEPGQKLF